MRPPPPGQLALVGIEDPLRAEAPAAIRQCQASGITVKMLTGGWGRGSARVCGCVGVCALLVCGGWVAVRASGGMGAPNAQPRRLAVPPPAPPAGDNVDTATAIARECGILPPLAAAAPAAAGQGAVVAADGWTAGGGALPEGAVMEGREFRQRVLRPDGSLDAAAFLELWPRLRVLARCTPADKYTIVTGAAPPPPSLAGGRQLALLPACWGCSWGRWSPLSLAGHQGCRTTLWRPSFAGSAAQHIRQPALGSPPPPHHTTHNHTTTPASEGWPSKTSTHALTHPPHASHPQACAA
jgi:hypothetical protein